MTFEIRPASPEDIPAIFALNRLIEIGDNLPLVTPIEEIEEWVDDPHFSFLDDSRLALRGGELVGFARLWHRPSDQIQVRAFMVGGVDPSHRRQGIGSSLLTWQMERGREILAAAPPGLPRYLSTMAYDFEKEAIALYEKHGLVPVRYSYELNRPLTVIPPVPATPGIDIVAWDPERDEELRQVTNAAFADHWGSTPVDRDAWVHRIQSFGARLDLSYMALDGDRVVGILLTNHFPGDEELTGRLDGWIMSLGTLRTHRKRGIASALVVTACHAYQSAGFNHAALGVDSENPTGAYRLYQQLGFTELNRSVHHEMEV
ncbi:MAG: GNAT family N-acetyltransferase [Acidimicrobiia bacterium]